MARKKLIRMRQAELLPYIISHADSQAIGKIQSFLHKARAVILELGCGQGEYAIALAQERPLVKVIGVDIQGERLWVGATQAQKLKLPNVIFLRTDARHLGRYLKPHSVSEIWIICPDPYPKKSDADKRLTSEHFLLLYQYLGQSRMLTHVKTDDANLASFTLATANKMGWKIKQAVSDTDTPSRSALTGIETYYERLHRQAGKKIAYLELQAPN